MNKFTYYFMNCITGGGGEQGAAFLQALVMWLDFFIDSEVFDIRTCQNQKGIPQGHVERTLCMSYSKKIKQSLIYDIEPKIHDLTQQDMKAAKGLAEKIVVDGTIRSAIYERNRFAEILAGFPAETQVVPTLAQQKSWDLDSIAKWV